MISIRTKIQKRIQKSKEGTLFFISDFAEHGNDVFISRLLSEFVSDGTLCRLANGIYYKPILTKFGILYPDVEQLAKAIADRDAAQILPTGSAALNMLGLSTQVPLNCVYLTSGSARKVVVGDKVLVFKRCIPKNFQYENEFLAILVQAMKALGQDGITQAHENAIRSLVAEHTEVESLQKDLSYAPIWIKKKLHSLMKGVAE